MLDPVRTDLIKYLFTFALSLDTRPKNKYTGASLVVQWLRICLPTQGTRVWSLVHGGFHILWSNQGPVPQLLSPPTVEPVLCNKRSPCNEKPAPQPREQSPLAATTESLCVATKSQHSQKKHKTPNKYMHSIPTHVFHLHTTHLTCSVVGQPVFAPWGPPSSS